MPQTPPAWLAYVGALGPLLAVAVAVGIGAVKVYLQRQAVRQDLFDKRFQIFRATYKVFDDFIAAGTDSYRVSQAQEEFEKDTAHADYLFGKDVVTALGMISQHLGVHCISLISFRHPEEGYFSEDSVAQNMKDFKESETALMHLRGTIPALFRPYLRVYHDRNWLLRFIDRLNAWADSRESVLIAGRKE